MKKILVILLGITIVLGTIGCGKANSNDNESDTIQNIQEEVSKSDSNKDTIEVKKTWYESVRWDDLATKKDVELKMFGLVDHPYNFIDFKEHIQEFHAYNCYDKDDKWIQNLQDFDTFFADGMKAPVSYSDTNGSASVILKNGAHLDLSITSTLENENNRVSISDALTNGEYIYFCNWTSDFLNIEKEEGPDNTKLLDAIIEKYGKPTKINMLLESEISEDSYSINQKYYDLCYEMDNYVLVVFVNENVSNYGNEEDDVKHEIETSVKLYTKTSYQQFLEHEAQ